MKTDTKKIGNIYHIIFLERNLSVHNSDELNQFFTSLVDNNPSNMYLLDFKDVHYIDSTAIGKLVSFAKELYTSVDNSSRKQILGICNLNENSRTLFQILNINTFFKVYQDFDTAINEMSSLENS